jgi:hypothetical protein
MYPAVIMPDGRATIAIPTNEESIVTTRPMVDTGYMSPYPIVVRLTVAQYIAEKKLSKVSGSTLKIINAHITIYAAAKTHTAKSGSFCFFITLEITVMLLEYLTILNTLNVRSNLKIFKILNPDAIMVNVGSMAKRSIIAIGVKG